MNDSELWSTITSVNGAIGDAFREMREASTSNAKGQLSLELDNLQLQRRHLLRMAGFGVTGDEPVTKVNVVHRVEGRVDNIEAQLGFAPLRGGPDKGEPEGDVNANPPVHDDELRR